MAPSRAPSALLLRSLRRLTTQQPCTESAFRAFSTTNPLCQEVEAQKSSTYRKVPPVVRRKARTFVHVPRLKSEPVKATRFPIGSRRRRAALAQSSGVPFDELPYQCFQEARKILISDRKEKLKKIETERARITRLQDVDPATFPGGDMYKQRRLKSMKEELEELKILADINDPNVKRRFEDGLGDLSKPIYRHLADRKWRQYPRKVLVQRITQMNVMPDVIPNVDPMLDVKIAFDQKVVQPGDFVESHISENPCRLTLQSYERGEKMVTVALVDADVPNVETDSFDFRCHFLATNIVISPTLPVVDLARLSSDSQVLLPWMPPYAQKGSPYHRLAIIILQQKNNIPIDLDIAKRHVRRDGFTVRSMMSRHMLSPLSASLFRTQWDDSTAAVMQRAGLEGSDVELKRKKVEPLPYQRRNTSRMRG